MKLIFALVLISSAANASKIRDHIRSLDRDGNQVTMTLRNHAQVFRFPASETFPCLENGYVARKPVDIIMNDKNEKVLACQLAPQIHPGAVKTN